MKILLILGGTCLFLLVIFTSIRRVMVLLAGVLVELVLIYLFNHGIIFPFHGIFMRYVVPIMTLFFIISIDDT